MYTSKKFKEFILRSENATISLFRKYLFCEQFQKINFHTKSNHELTEVTNKQYLRFYFRFYFTEDDRLQVKKFETLFK